MEKQEIKTNIENLTTNVEDNLESFQEFRQKSSEYDRHDCLEKFKEVMMDDMD